MRLFWCVLGLLVRCLGMVALALALLILALGMAAGDYVALATGALALDEGVGFFGALLLCGLGLPLTYLLAVVAHELGHLLGGWSAGLSPRFAHAGPLTLSKEGGRWRVGWDGHWPWLGGRAYCLAPSAARWRWVVLVLGGPLANLLLGVPAAWLAVGDLPLPPLPRCWVGMFAAHSLFLGVVNLLPFRDRGLDSDGLVLLHLLAGGRSPPNPDGIPLTGGVPVRD